jgi:hypothetical protein
VLIEAGGSRVLATAVKRVCWERASEEIYNEIVIVKFFMVQVLTKGLYTITISSIAVPLCMQCERE